MRIHSDVIADLAAIRLELRVEQLAGRIASHVSFKTLAAHASRSHARAFEIQLEAEERDNGRRAGNSGSYGAMRPEVDGYAATYDEWGWLLAALYRLDPGMVVGTPKNPTYRDAEHFHEHTAWTYDPMRWLAYVLDWPTFADERDPFPVVTGQAAKTRRGYLEGRRGAGRVREIERAYWSHKVQPRTVREVVEFAHLDWSAVAAAFPSAGDHLAELAAEVSA